MFGTKVTMKIRRAGESISLIDIQGEINRSSEAALLRAYNEASQGDTRTILLNFTGLEYMNSSGVGLLVTLLVRAQRQDQRLIAFGLNEHYRQIFELTRLNEAIQVYEDEATALKAASLPSSEESITRKNDLLLSKGGQRGNHPADEIF